MTDPPPLPSDGQADGVLKTDTNHRLHEPCLFMRLGARWFALPTAHVVLIAPKGVLTRVPMAPPHLLGIASLRGRWMTVVNLETMLGKTPSIDGKLPTTLPRLVVVTSGQDELAIVADEMDGPDRQVLPRVLETKEAEGIVRGEFDWRGHRVFLLDLVRLVTMAIERASKLFTQGRIDA